MPKSCRPAAGLVIALSLLAGVALAGEQPRGPSGRVLPVVTHPHALQKATDCDQLRGYLTDVMVETLVRNLYWWWPLPWAGGGYFRIIPYGLYRWGVARRLRERASFMFYFHPWELDAEEQPPPNLSRAMTFRAYVGRRRMRDDLRRLLGDLAMRQRVVNRRAGLCSHQGEYIQLFLRER